VAALLGDKVALVEYVVTRDEVIIFVVDQHGVSAAREPVKHETLAALAHRFRSLIQDSAPMDAESRELDRLLIEPVREKLKDAAILAIAPHRELHYVSFAALNDGTGYLIDRYPLFYLPAASVFEYTVRRRSATPKSKMRALAVGNPDLGDLNTDLPLAEFEAQSIRWSFPSVDVLVRGKATETSVVKKAGGYDLVHIASHGQFDPANPLLSSLRLSGDESNDGALSAQEVFGLSLDAQLVIMSACQTGLGQVSSGDEVVGLNRAFLYSGAHSVISTLWRVDDLASAVLMKHFYRDFASLAPAEALRKAQLTVKRRFPHPSFWAGFTLVGDYL